MKLSSTAKSCLRADPLNPEKMARKKSPDIYRHASILNVFLFSLTYWLKDIFWESFLLVKMTLTKVPEGFSEVSDPLKVNVSPLRKALGMSWSRIKSLIGVVPKVL